MKPDDIAEYLKQVYQKEIVVTGTGKLGETEEGLKEFGYGKPLLIRFSADGESRTAVLSAMRTEGGFRSIWKNREMGGYVGELNTYMISNFVT